MALVEPAALMDGLEEAPDVFDVRVAERVVVVLPVHPLAEAAALLGHDLAVVGDAFAALFCELREPVLLDLALVVQVQRLLDLDLYPKALRVEAVLIALVETAEGLVALEDVLQRAAVPVVDARRVVGGDRAVHEGEGRAAGVLLPEPPEGLLALPALEHGFLERRMVRHRRQGLKDWLAHREAKCRERRSYSWRIG